jgi:hypothetical protein
MKIRLTTAFIVFAFFGGCPATAEELWGFIDTHGNWVIKPQYAEALPFDNGRAVVYSKDPATGRKVSHTIDKSGATVPEKEIYAKLVTSKVTGLPLPFVSTDKSGRSIYVYAGGKRAIERSFAYGDEFNSNGTAVVKEEQDQPFAMIDSRGNIVSRLNNQVEALCGEWSEGRRQFSAKSSYCNYGYIDESGRIAIAPKFAFVRDFHDGLACVMLNGRWQYIDKVGHTRIKLPADASSAGDFDKGLAAITVGGIPFEGQSINPRHEARLGFINKNGRFVIQPKYEIWPYFFGLEPLFSDGRAVVGQNINRRRLFGYIDENDKMVIEPKFTHARTFSEGLAAASVYGETFDAAEFASTLPSRDRAKQCENVFRQYDVIGMNKDKVHTLLGSPDRAGRIVEMSASLSWGPFLGSAITPKNDRDTYILSTSSCAHGAYWLEIEYADSKVRRYRLASIDRLGNWLSDGRPPSLEFELIVPPRSAIPRVSTVGFQINPVEAGKSPVIGSVQPGLPADRGGLHRGDEVLAINGLSTVRLTQDQILELVAGPPDSYLSLQIRRADTVFTKRLKRIWIGSIKDVGLLCHYLNDLE